ncbi:MAG: hypothetical protein J6J90_05055, partial [Angelakisella sp.]|nr:hypothetical protein [Angelakisella sp.]
AAIGDRRFRRSRNALRAGTGILHKSAKQCGSKPRRVPNKQDSAQNNLTSKGSYAKISDAACDGLF